MKCHNRAQYDAHAEFYHRKRRSKTSGYWNEFVDWPAVRALLRGETRGRRVLDLGCGTGILCGRFRGAASVTGVDNSAAMLAIARRGNPSARFVLADAARTGLASGDFDTVCAALLPHYFRDLRPLFTEAARLLRPGGVFVFSMHHPFGEITDCKRGRITGPYFSRIRYMWNMGEMKMASYHHTMEDIAQTLHRCGFAVEQLLEPRPLPSSRRHDPKSYAAASRYPSFCAVKARKIPVWNADWGKPGTRAGNCRNPSASAGRAAKTGAFSRRGHI
ncbi:MAG: class I SAM-dependent methyltransferase [Elusimicrobiales bacterium]